METTTKITVEITKDDIDNGKQANSYSCAFASALSRSLPNMKKVYVIPSGAFVTLRSGKKIMLPFNSKVGDWIINFDLNKDSLSPTTFELDLVDVEK